MKKKQLGQFFTIHSDYILNGFEGFIRGKKIIDPFAGSGDLIKWAKKNGAKNVKGFDVDKKYVNDKSIFLNDSINNPKVYDFVITNPPYLNINKADIETKEKYFSKTNLEDLYQISLSSIINSQEGIVIVPINFLSAENSMKIRDLFFSRFKIIKMNYFKQQVFPDTTYNVISFYYKQKENSFVDKFIIDTTINPDNQRVDIELHKKFHWSIGGNFLATIKNQKNVLGIYRLTDKDIKSGPIKIKAAYNHINNRHDFKISKDVYNLIKSNIILLKAIDSGSEEGKIALENIKNYGVECLISKKTSRHMIYLISETKLSIGEQKKIIDLFNQEMEKLRSNYLSLFLTNYRDNNRKRVSFDFVYKFINYLYSNKIQDNPVRSLYY